ncbi:hypothetical protein [Derxia gummosa]|uniref:Uncharacterized protein n=1 Tax=Derxia gummosa DSM 723 TaxID=1121388 RepID=A0A8B6X3I0_9BURK|nr:hypothetical protein [Derxia gummosa]
MTRRRTPKNPFMSLWLSAANSMLGSARGHVANAVRRQTGTAKAQMTKQIVDFWTGGMLKPPAKARRRKTGR